MFIEKKASNNMTHDPLSRNPEMDAMSGYSETHDLMCPTEQCVICEWAKDNTKWCATCGGCACGLIAKVRENERNKFLPAHWSQEWHLGYLQGVADTEKV